MFEAILKQVTACISACITLYC